MTDTINTFKVGTNFDKELPNKLNELNLKYNDKITEVFGSIREHSRYAARPDFRLPDVTLKQLEEHITDLKTANIEFNYTLNAPFIGSSSDVNEKDILKMVGLLRECGVKRFTITSPLLAKIIHNEDKNIELELSTIAHLSQVSQLKSYNQFAGFTRFCMNLEKNRSFSFLQNCQRVAKLNGFVINLMVNEFCSSSDVGYSSHCVLRNDCYLLHSVNKTKEDYELHGGYPMNFCMAGREIEPYSWLRSRFILPEWISVYNKHTNITHFKITGRTGTTEYITKVCNAYLSGEFHGDLLELWKHLDTIYSNENDTTVKNKQLSCDLINKHRFIGHWIPMFKNEYCSFECSNVECGKECNYCEEFWRRNLQ
jgi:collagenase-like PrtC family protease